MAIVGTAKVADKAANALFRWATTDHLGVTTNVPRGLGFWQEMKWILMRLVVGIGCLLFTWGIVIGAMLFFGRP